MNLKKITFPVLIFAVSRIAIFLLASLAIAIFPTKTHPDFLNAFSQWDGQWYLEILTKGYWYKGASVQSPVIFFPLFPMIGSVLTYLKFSPELSLFTISNISSLGFFIFLWLLTKQKFGEKVANNTILYFAISPLSYIFSSLYAESLFFFLSCFFFYLAERKKYFVAGIIASLASATRPFGAMLFPAYIFYLFRAKKSFFQIFVYGVMSLLGLAAFCVYLYKLTGVIFPFVQVQHEAWHHIPTLPWKTFEILWRAIISFENPNPFYIILIFDFVMLSLFGVLLMLSLKKIAIQYLLFIIPAYLLTVTQLWDPRFFLPSASMSRHLFQMFPLFWIMALAGEKYKILHFSIIFLFGALFGPFALAFFNGFWVQ